MTNRLEKRIARRFGLSAVVLVLMSVVAVFALAGSITTSRHVTRSHTVLVGLERVLSLVRDAESGQRGYLLTGREDYLGPYVRATEALRVQLDDLEGLLAESSPARENFHAIRALIDEKQRELRETIAARRRAGPDEALRIVMTHRGTRTMSALRHAVGTLRSEQQGARARKMQRADLASRVALAALTLGVVFSLMLMVFAQRLITAEMSRRRQTEADLKAARALAEAASRAKGDFLANMSHEIRTPMNGILGMTELALGTRLSDQQREYLGLVKSSADALLEVIDDILDFSKIEAGKLALSPAPFDLHNMCADTVRTLALRAHEKGLELSLRISPAVPARVIGDSGRLRQVLTNLVGNAIKFTDRGEVAVSVDDESNDSGSLALRIAVADTGIGVPVDKRAIIFSAFEQADSSTTRRFGGTGLGLAISARLVQMMGGSIGVDDNHGGGSIFRFTVRLDRDPSSRIERATAEETPLAGVRVLIVDDNRTNRLILEELLARWGTTPCAVDGGQAALDALDRGAREGRPFDIMLLDRMMPAMDGLELAERTCLDPRFDGLKLLLLTSAGGLGESAHYAALGIATFLTKPVRQSELFNALIELIDSERESRTPAVDSAAAPNIPSRRLGHAPLRVLLAEDHPVNQRVATHMLQQLGHEVTLVGDGSAAVRAVAERDFDLVLMDVQMPMMDGFEAVATIRERERLTGRHTRIIALTAHALAGDRDRCLAGGFDGYLAKPVRAAALSELIDGMCPAPPRSNGPGEPVDHSPPAYDRTDALKNLFGDEQLLAEILSIFLDEGERFLAELRDASARGDHDTIQRVSHAAAGAALHCAAFRVEKAARRLEAIGAGGELTDVPAAYAELAAAFSEFRRAAEPDLAGAPSARQTPASSDKHETSLMTEWRI